MKPIVFGKRDEERKIKKINVKTKKKNINYST